MVWPSHAFQAGTTEDLVGGDDGEPVVIGLVGLGAAGYAYCAAGK
jgi:hypothetical protein